jgi:hypothetical protein
MASDYELGTDPGDGQGIAVGEFILADGTVSLILPKHWELLRENYESARFAIPELPGATLMIEINVFDDPTSIAANDLLGYINDPGFPPLADDALDHVRDANGEPDFEKLTLRLDGTTRGADDSGDRRNVEVWQKLGLHRPNFIRVLSVQLRIPESTAGSVAAREAEDVVDHLLKFVRFADHETPADRVAASVDFRRDTLWDTIAFRVPGDWPEAEWDNEDGAGMYVYDDKQADRWTLWIDFDAYRRKRDETLFDVGQFAAGLAGGMKRSRRDLIEATHDPMPDRANEAVAKVVYNSVENGEKLRHISWHKVMVRGATVIVGHFTLVVREAIHDDPDIVALTTLLERECGNAVLVDRDTVALKQPAAGNA